MQILTSKMLSLINKIAISYWCAKGLIGVYLVAICFAYYAQADPGDLDESFGIDGKVTAGFGIGSRDEARAIVIQSDGKIVAAGVSDADGSDDFALARYNTDGSLDTSFGDQGVVLDDFGGLGRMQSANAIALQPTGSIVVAGTATLSVLGSEFSGAAVARYNTDGSPDNSFGVDGLVLPSLFLVSDARALAIQEDGKIIVAGEIIENSPDFFVVRLNADGSLDSSFGDAGAVLTDFGSFDRADALAIQSDGRIVAAGTSNAGGNSTNFALARYDPDGTLDDSFGTGGTVVSDFSGGIIGDQVRALVIQSDGKIVVAGVSEASGSDDFALARYNTDGTLDINFGIGGLVLTDFSGDGSSESIRALSLQSDGKIVAAGASAADDSLDFALARYDTDGDLDNSFGIGGKVLTDFSGDGSSDAALALAIQTDGKIVAAGDSNADDADGRRDFALVRYLASDPVPTPSPPPMPGIEPGDANGDGEINILDVTAILNDILGISDAPGNGDCNEDLMVNILDVTCVLNIILEG